MLPEIALPQRVAAVFLALGLGCGGCGRAPGEGRSRPPHPGAQPLALSVQATSDTGPMQRLEIRPPPPARDWMTRVTPSRPVALHPPLPEAAPDTLIPASPTPPVLEVDPGLEPPILRGPAPLAVPPAGHRVRRFEFVDLDVRVSETGEVTDVLPAGGNADPDLVAAAGSCARRMHFYPALRGGQPVAVWCRQRFDFGPGGAVRP